MRFSKWLILGAICLVAVSAQAQWQRTISAIDAITPEASKVQVEGTYMHAKGPDGDYDVDFFSVLGRYGILDNWSAEIAPNYVSVDYDDDGSDSGFGDLWVGTEYRFLDESKNGVDCAVEFGGTLPTGDEDEVGSGSVEPELDLIAAKTFGAFTFVGNVGGYVILDNDEGEEDTVGLATLESVFSVNDKTTLNAWLDGSTGRWEGEDDLVYLGVGPRFLPAENVLTWASVDVGLTDDSDDWSIHIGGGYEF